MKSKDRWKEFALRHKRISDWMVETWEMMQKNPVCQHANSIIEFVPPDCAVGGFLAENTLNFPIEARGCHFRHHSYLLLFETESQLYFDFTAYQHMDQDMLAGGRTLVMVGNEEEMKKLGYDFSNVHLRHVQNQTKSAMKDYQLFKKEFIW